jgi:tRNA dimethylallyltransferase
MQRYFLLGPTASGKTRVALALAEPLDAEIVSMDSMLVYRGMDLGTAKPSAEEQAAVPHHLIDLVAPHEEYSVARYLEAARSCEADLAARGKNALFVGGTNLYLKALTAGLLESPPVAAEIRAEVRSLAESPAGLRQLFRELQGVDPESATRIHSNDAQRISRAIEMYRATGRTLTDWQREWRPAQALAEPALALEWPRDTLRERVSRRFSQMLNDGFLDEIRTIQASGGFGPTAAKALGYRQMIDFLAGGSSREVATERAINGTRTYIRRQMTWLRSFPDLNWIAMCDDAGNPRPTNELAAACLAALNVVSLSRTPQQDSTHD